MGKVKESLLTTNDLYVNSGGERWVEYKPCQVMILLTKLKVMDYDTINYMLKDGIINHIEARSFKYTSDTGRIMGDDKEANGGDRF